jgi:hypothetical protein
VVWKGVARLQLDNEANWRAKLIDGMPPLQVAVEKGHAAAVETLLSGGVDANVAAKGTSLVALASGKKRSDIVALLVNAGGRRTAWRRRRRRRSGGGWWWDVGRGKEVVRRTPQQHSPFIVSRERTPSPIARAAVPSSSSSPPHAIPTVSPPLPLSHTPIHRVSHLAHPEAACSYRTRRGTGS